MDPGAAVPDYDPHLAAHVQAAVQAAMALHMHPALQAVISLQSKVESLEKALGSSSKTASADVLAALQGTLPQVLGDLIDSKLNDLQAQIDDIQRRLQIMEYNQSIVEAERQAQADMAKSLASFGTHAHVHKEVARDGARKTGLSMQSAPPSLLKPGETSPVTPATPASLDLQPGKEFSISTPTTSEPGWHHPAPTTSEPGWQNVGTG